MFKNETKIGYALALLEIAQDEKKIKEYYDEINIILEVLEENKEIENILDNFSLNESKKIKIIDESFKKINVNLINTMKILSIKNQFKYFNDILNYLLKYIQEILNIKQGIIYTVDPISKKDIKKLEAKLSKEKGYKIQLKNLIDKELIGGFKIEIGTLVIEDSIKSELEAMKTKLSLKKGGE